MHMWHHVTNHLIISNDKDSNSENRIKLRVRDTEGPSPYWYKLNTTSRQADTTSTGTWKATDTTSERTSNESVRVTSHKYY
jgi:hypothetical protein